MEIDAFKSGSIEIGGIELIAVPSAEAVERFNQEQEEGARKVIALIHITCQAPRRYSPGPVSVDGAVGHHQLRKHIRRTRRFRTSRSPAA